MFLIFEKERLIIFAQTVSWGKVLSVRKRPGSFSGVLLYFIQGGLLIITSYFTHTPFLSMGLPKWLSGKESACQCRRQGFDPWVRKIPWRRERQPTPVLLPGEIPWTEGAGGLQSMGSWRAVHDWAHIHTHTYPQVPRYALYSSFIQQMLIDTYWIYWHSSFHKVCI